VKKVSIRPLDDRLLVRPDEPESTSKGGIILPGIAKDRFPALGVVLAVGPGKMNGEGVRRPPAMKAGDRIIYGKYQGTDVEVAGETVKFLKADDVLAVLAEVEMVTCVEVNVMGCDRCGQDHPGLAFAEMDNPPDDYKWFGECPVKRQPILMRFVDDNSTDNSDT
jgi:chaperonin GroES